MIEVKLLIAGHQWQRSRRIFQKSQAVFASYCNDSSYITACTTPLYCAPVLKEGAFAFCTNNRQSPKSFFSSVQRQSADNSQFVSISSA
jgi:hypothetical protein